MKNHPVEEIAPILAGTDLPVEKIATTRAGTDLSVKNRYPTNNNPTNNTPTKAIPQRPERNDCRLGGAHLAGWWDFFCRGALSRRARIPKIKFGAPSTGEGGQIN